MRAQGSVRGEGYLMIGYRATEDREVRCGLRVKVGDWEGWRYGLNYVLHFQGAAWASHCEVREHMTCYHRLIRPLSPCFHRPEQGESRLNREDCQVERTGCPRSLAIGSPLSYVVGYGILKRQSTASIGREVISGGQVPLRRLPPRSRPLPPRYCGAEARSRAPATLC